MPCLVHKSFRSIAPVSGAEDPGLVLAMCPVSSVSAPETELAGVGAWDEPSLLLDPERFPVPFWVLGVCQIGSGLVHQSQMALHEIHLIASVEADMDGGVWLDASMLRMVSILSLMSMMIVLILSIIATVKGEAVDCPESADM